MNDQLRSAIDVLLEQLKEQQKEVTDTKRTINSLLRRLGEQPMFSDTDLDDSGSSASLRPDEFYGKGFATAVQDFLKKRKQALTAEQIMRGLEKGGFDFRNWKEDVRVRLIASNLTKNNVTFHKLPNNTFGLLSWYPDIKSRRDDKAAEEEQSKKEQPSRTPKRPDAQTEKRKRGRPKKQIESMENIEQQEVNQEEKYEEK